MFCFGVFYCVVVFLHMDFVSGFGAIGNMFFEIFTGRDARRADGHPRSQRPFLKKAAPIQITNYSSIALPLLLSSFLKYYTSKI